MIFVAGDNGQVLGISRNDHKIIDKWSIGDPITAIDCINQLDGGIVFAMGTSKGRIVLRYDWEEFPKSFCCNE